MIPPLATRFVAGETAAGAIEHARALADRDLGAILNLLGEHYDDVAAVRADVRGYEALIEALEPLSIDACISVKPTQLGLAIDEATFRESLDRLLGHADEHGVFVWIDMENHETIQATLDGYVDQTTARDGGVGCCLQSNMRRTREDLERVAELPGKIRLVKGAYNPPEPVAFQSRERVNQAYRDDLTYMFEHFEGGIAVGSHDPAMIEHAERLHEDHGTPFEIQMLMGVREDAQTELATAYPVYQYAPYGEKWLAYFYRRVVERKENALFALRAIMGR